MSSAQTGIIIGVTIGVTIFFVILIVVCALGYRQHSKQRKERLQRLRQQREERQRRRAQEQEERQQRRRRPRHPEALPVENYQELFGDEEPAPGNVIIRDKQELLELKNVIVRVQAGESDQDEEVEEEYSDRGPDSFLPSAIVTRVNSFVRRGLRSANNSIMASPAATFDHFAPVNQPADYSASPSLQERAAPASNGGSLNASVTRGHRPPALLSPQQVSRQSPADPDGSGTASSMPAPLMFTRNVEMSLSSPANLYVDPRVGGNDSVVLNGSQSYQEPRTLFADNSPVNENLWTAAPNGGSTVVSPTSVSAGSHFHRPPATIRHDANRHFGGNGTAHSLAGGAFTGSTFGPPAADFSAPPSFGAAPTPTELAPSSRLGKHQAKPHHPYHTTQLSGSHAFGSIPPSPNVHLSVEHGSFAAGKRSTARREKHHEAKEQKKRINRNRNIDKGGYVVFEVDEAADAAAAAAAAAEAEAAAQEGNEDSKEQKKRYYYYEKKPSMEVYGTADYWHASSHNSLGFNGSGVHGNAFLTPQQMSFNNPGFAGYHNVQSVPSGGASYADPAVGDFSRPAPRQHPSQLPLSPMSSDGRVFGSYVNNSSSGVSPGNRVGGFSGHTTLLHPVQVPHVTTESGHLDSAPLSPLQPLQNYDKDFQSIRYE